jgi:hypothetical protein
VVFEQLVAIVAEMKADQEMLTNMDAWLEETKCYLEATKACLGKTETWIETGQERKEAKIKIGLGGAKATDLGVNPEETEAAEETIGASEEQLQD